MIHVLEADLDVHTHAEAVLTLLDEYARDPMGGGAPLPGDTRARLIPEIRKRPGVRILLAFRNDRAVGLLTTIEGFSTFAAKPLLNIHDAVVSQDHRGQGISTRLLEAAEALALRLGCCKLTLEVLEGNTVAQAAYRSFGFSGYALDPRMGSALFWEKKLPPPGTSA